MALPRNNGRWPVGPNFLETEYKTKAKNRCHFKRKQDNGRPRRTVTGYDVFLRNTFPEFRKNFPGLSQQQVFSMIGKAWREQTTWQDRQICYDFADEEKDKYMYESKEWRKRRSTIRERQKAERMKLVATRKSAAASRKVESPDADDHNDAAIPVPGNEPNDQAANEAYEPVECNVQ